MANQRAIVNKLISILPIPKTWAGNASIGALWYFSIASIEYKLSIVWNGFSATKTSDM